MPRYEYIAIAGNGKKIKGTLNAESPFAARKQLRMRSIHPSSVTEITSAVESKRALFSVFRRTSKSQLIDFTKQLATLGTPGSSSPRLCRS
jgi:general secretion pathway protein F